MGNANCCKRGEPFIPGEVLDRVIAEKSADDKCQLYELANFRKSGILIEAFNNGGSKGVSKHFLKSFHTLFPYFFLSLYNFIFHLSFSPHFAARRYH